MPLAPSPEESQSDFMHRCVPHQMDKGMDQDQAVAACMSMYEEPAGGRSKRPEIEYRTIQEIRTDGRKLIGYAAKFNTSAEIADPFVGAFNETIRPGAFRESLQANADILALMDHDRTKLLARTKSQTLRLSEDGTGLRFEIQLPNTQVGRDALALAERGDLGGMSFGFNVPHGGDSWSKDMTSRELNRIDLREISVISAWPAYKDTEVFARSKTPSLQGSNGRSTVVYLKTMPAAASNPPVRNHMIPITEQITSFTNQRAEVDARRVAIMEKAANENRTLDENEKEQLTGVKTQLRQIDEHLVELREFEADLKNKAVAVTIDEKKPEAVQELRAPRQVITPISVRANVEPGIAFTRYVGALITCKLNNMDPVQYAYRRWKDSTPHVAKAIEEMRTAVEAGDTTTSGWASQLVPNAQLLQQEFLDMLRPSTLIGRIPGLNRVPYNVTIPVQSAKGTYAWVGEGAPKPVTKPTLTSITLRFMKAAGIIVITKELAKFSTPSAELFVRNEMLRSITTFLDEQFVDPSIVGVTNVQPASITNGVTGIGASGTTAAAFRSDFMEAMANINTNNQNPGEFVILMSASVASNLSALVNSLSSAPEFPQLSPAGGSVYGMPVIVSQSVGARVIFINPSQVYYANDGGIEIDVSDQASVEMDTAPAIGESSPITDVGSLKSLWQNNLIGFRAEIMVDWKRGRTSAVEYIYNAVYSG